MQEFLIFKVGQERTNDCVVTDGRQPQLQPGLFAIPWGAEADQRQPESWRLSGMQIVYDPIPEPETQATPDLPGFYKDLALAILSGQLPEDVRAKALLINDLQDPAIQNEAFQQLVKNPAYTPEHLILISQLIVKHKLALKV
jgi:hypothetical protein